MTAACVLAAFAATIVLASAGPVPPPCSLNGVLAGDTCVCAPGWTGPTCRTLNLAPAPPLVPSSQVYLNKSDNSWGFSALPGDGDGLYHGFMTELEGGCSLLEYGLASRILHLTATSAFGPWTVQGVALPAFAHNSQVVRDADGGWLIVHIGATTWCGMTCNGTHSHGNASCTSVGKGTSIARAPSPYGPWDVQNFVLPNNETNPSAVVLPNGTIVLTARRWTAGVPIYIADSWRGPFKLSWAPVVTIAVNGSTTEAGNSTTSFDEDPYLYRGENGTWHMLTHRQPHGTNCPPTGGTDDCRCAGGHMYAEDVFGPWFVDEQLIYNCSLSVEGAAPVELHARQRPTLFWPSPGACPTLFTGASNDPVSQYYSSFSMGQSVVC